MADVRVPLEWLENYARSIRDLDEISRSLLVDALYNTDLSNREAVVATMQAICDTSGEAATEMSVQFYRGLSMLQTGQDMTKRVPYARDKAKIRAATLGIMNDAADEADLVGQLSDRLSYETGRAAKMGMWRAGQADERDVRYARVPVGEETCAWCIMTAGLGFWYMTEEAASHTHAHCVVGDTEVCGTGLLACLRREYEGPLVHIVTVKGRNLTVTPNHPILTTRGWKSAGDLIEGDDLLCAPPVHGHAAGVPDVCDAPPTAEQLFESAGFLDAAVFHGMPTSAKDFYSEMFADCDVNVVSPDGLLERALKASLGEPSQHERLSRAGLPESVAGLTLDGDGSACGLLGPHHAATGGIVRGGSLCGALLGSHGGSSQQPSLGASTMGKPSIANPSVNNVSADAEATRDGVDALSVLERFDRARWWSDALLAWLDASALQDSVDVGVADASPIRDFRWPETSQIEVDSLCSLSVSEGRCHVYNLSTSGGWYASSGIITHNCDCIIVPSIGRGSVRIDGYDSDEMRDMWRTANKMRADGNIPDELAERIGREKAAKGDAYREDTNGTLAVMRWMYGLK